VAINPGSEASTLFRAGALIDGDYQLYARFSPDTLPEGVPVVLVDYLEYVVPLFHSVLRVLR